MPAVSHESGVSKLLHCLRQLNPSGLQVPAMSATALSQIIPLPRAGPCAAFDAPPRLRD